MGLAIEGGNAETKNTNPQGGGALNSIVGGAMGLITANYNDSRQRKMNADLIRQQMEGGKEMGRFNQQMALDMWEKTGFEAQRKQMERAGLNPGLMYGGTGSGGTTQGGQATMPSSSSAPAGGGEIGMGLSMAMQMAMMQAQIENTKANTAKTEAETPKVGAEQQNVEQDTALKLQQTGNAALDGLIKHYEAKIKEVEMNIVRDTEADSVEAIRNANDITEQQIRTARVGAEIAEGTKDEIIKQLNTNSKEQALRIAAQQKGLIKTDAEIGGIKQGIHNMITDVQMQIQANQRQWDQLSQRDKEIAIAQKVQETAQKQTEFNTSTPQQVKQWTDLIMSVITIGASGGSAAPAAGFKFK